MDFGGKYAPPSFLLSCVPYIFELLTPSWKPQDRYCNDDFEVTAMVGGSNNLLRLEFTKTSRETFKMTS